MKKRHYDMYLGLRLESFAAIRSGDVAVIIFSFVDDATRAALPAFNEKGGLILPKNFNEWVYVGSPLTPDGLNGGKVHFSEYHNVCIEPGSYAIYK